MHIIFGKEQVDELSNKYTILELDMFQIGENGPVVTAYCTVETIPFEELSTLETAKIQHQHVILNYRGRAWQDCLTGIDQLMGKWRGELDSFYNDLRDRAQMNMAHPPPPDWSPVIQK